MATKPKQAPEQEILARVRRIETRLTQLLIANNVGTKVDKPILSADGRSIQIPSIHSSMQEILDSLPEGWQGPVEVWCGASFVATLTR